MDIDRERNYYSYGKFGYLAKNCRNQSLVGQGEKIEYKNNLNTTNNLKEKENLVILN